MSEDDIENSRDIGGGNPLLAYIDCFNSSIKISTSSGTSNFT